MTRYLLLLAVLGGACKKEHEIAALDAVATVEGPAVIITATCTNFEGLSAPDRGGVFTQCKDGKARLEIPADKVGTGKQKIYVRASNKHGMTIADANLTVDVSLAGQPPYLRVSGCERDPDGSATNLEVKVGERTERCNTFDGANAKLTIEANPNAKLTIAGKMQTVPASGKLTHLVDLTEPVLALELADVAVDPKEPSKSRPKATVAVPYALESDGKALAGNLEFTEVVGFEGQLGSRFLAAVGAGKAERGGFTVAKPGERRTVGWVAHDGKLRVTDRSGTIGDIDLIAVEHETARNENGTCDYVAEGKEVRAKRVLIDIELAVMNIADGSVEKKPFPASTDPRNCPTFSVMDRKEPTVEARIVDDAVMAWLDTVAEPR